MSFRTQRAALTSICCAFLLTIAACGAEEPAAELETTDAAVRGLPDLAPGAALTPRGVDTHGFASFDTGRVRTKDNARFENLGAYRNDVPEMPGLGNYVFERTSVAGIDGVHTYRADGQDEAWVGVLKLDRDNEFVLDARHVVNGEYERQVEYAGMYRVAGGYIDFADERGRFMFRMSYELHRTTNTLYLRHDDAMGPVEEGEISGIVARLR